MGKHVLLAFVFSAVTAVTGVTSFICNGLPVTSGVAYAVTGVTLGAVCWGRKCCV